jgi:hypothetical protein
MTTEERWFNFAKGNPKWRNLTYFTAYMPVPGGILVKSSTFSGSDATMVFIPDPPEQK